MGAVGAVKAPHVEPSASNQKQIPNSKMNKQYITIEEEKPSNKIQVDHMADKDVDNQMDLLGELVGYTPGESQTELH